MGLRCALPNDELCIDRCHFEKCNYLSDKADGPVLSGICCASIKSLVLEKELLTHKHWRVDRFPYASMNKHTHLNRYMNTHLQFSHMDTTQADDFQQIGQAKATTESKCIITIWYLVDLSCWCSVEGQYLPSLIVQFS